MCRGLSSHASKYTEASPNACAACACVVANAARSSCSVSALAMPMPPPPAAGFNSTGKPILRAAASKAVSSARTSLPARTGTPAAAIAARERVFSPNVSIQCGCGPMKWMPAAATARGEAGVFGQEAVARMQCVGAGRLGGGDYAVDVEIRVRGLIARQPRRGRGFCEMRRLCVDVRVGGYALDTEFRACSHDAAGHRGTVGDEDSPEHGASGLVVEQTQIGVRHGDAVLAARCGHLVVAAAAAGLCDEPHSVPLRVIDVVAERNEAVADQRDAVPCRRASPSVRPARAVAAGDARACTKAVCSVAVMSPSM